MEASLKLCATAAAATGGTGGAQALRRALITLLPLVLPVTQLATIIIALLARLRRWAGGSPNVHKCVQLGNPRWRSREV